MREAFVEQGASRYLAQLLDSSSATAGLGSRNRTALAQTLPGRSQGPVTLSEAAHRFRVPIGCLASLLARACEVSIEGLPETLPLNPESVFPRSRREMIVAAHFLPARVPLPIFLHVNAHTAVGTSSPWTGWEVIRRTSSDLFSEMAGTIPSAWEVHTADDWFRCLLEYVSEETIPSLGFGIGLTKRHQRLDLEDYDFANSLESTARMIGDPSLVARGRDFFDALLAQFWADAWLEERPENGGDAPLESSNQEEREALHGTRRTSPPIFFEIDAGVLTCFVVRYGRVDGHAWVSLGEGDRVRKNLVLEFRSDLTPRVRCSSAEIDSEIANISGSDVMRGIKRYGLWSFLTGPQREPPGENELLSTYRYPHHARAPTNASRDS